MIGVGGEEIDRNAKSPAYTPERNELGLPTPTEEIGFSLGERLESIGISEGGKV